MTPFKFRRSKGIIWVCDLASSSSYLNNDDSVDQIEEFIPRLYYISKLIVESFGGVYLKWTGDGFLAFFEIELDRHKDVIANKVFEAVWHLTVLSNLTQLGIKSKKKFKIRHGVTYEKDALLMTISENGQTTMDIIGRVVVLAFRLSGIQCESPSIATVRELTLSTKRSFKKWSPTQEERMKFFKGEKFGLSSVVVSATNNFKRGSIKSATRHAKKAIASVENPKEQLSESNPVNIFVKAMYNGPTWCQTIIKEEADFVMNDLLGTLKSIVKVMDENKNGL